MTAAVLTESDLRTDHLLSSSPVISSTTDAAIEVRCLTRQYDDFTAVDKLSFAVKPGELFGFLGPNGAGKSTTIKMLCTLLRPTAGSAFVNGYEISREPARVRESIGIVF